VPDSAVQLIGVEAAGEGIATGKHAASIVAGRVGILHGSRSYVLQTDDGQIFAGPKEIFGYLSGLPEGEWASAHRERYREHAGERRLELTAQELDRRAPLDS